MTQAELAKKIGYTSRVSVNKIELNQRNLKQSKIKAIADALGVTPTYIMGWEDEEPETVPAPATELAADEEQLLEYYRKASPEMQEAVRRVLKMPEEEEFPKGKNQNSLAS